MQVVGVLGLLTRVDRARVPVRVERRPGAEMALPGVEGAVRLPHDCDGCPMPVGDGFPVAFAAVAPVSTKVAELRAMAADWTRKFMTVPLFTW